MLTITAAQKQAMSDRRYEGFAERARRHLVRLWPIRCRDLGDQAVRERIDEAVTRARVYGLTTERQAICFLDMTFLLGRDFDRNNEPEGVFEILVRPYPGNTKAKLLYDMARAVQRGERFEVAP